mmetsp:Transcript_55575/g.68048  ORF Transcript_55575/g.68048 Transcript_55575/m.68048 type:complete len:229 (+) Transcript_55575:1411-2097(+)
MGSENLSKKFMLEKTFTLTAWLTNFSCDAPGPKSSLASLATCARPCNKPSNAQPGALEPPAWWVAVAPAMAPQFVWPRTKIKRLPNLPVANSRDPTILPSACVQVLPALRNTKSSPGMASKTVSTGTRESAQPMMAVWGAWLYFTKAFLMSLEVVLVVEPPVAKRSLPSFNIFKAASDGTGASAAVRMPCRPRLASSVTMDGGMAVELSNSAACRGDLPRNSTLPVSK